MFSAIAPRYDFLNHLLSLQIDRHWRKIAVSTLKEKLNQDHPLCLDLCCGTGDLGLEMSRFGIADVVGCDFSHPMLKLNREKIEACPPGRRMHVVEADALKLPFESDTFDGVAIAFGLRNLDDVNQGLSEMHRILRPGGCLVVLEFSKPAHPWFDRLFQFYFFRVLPRIGNAISGHDHAYTYLPASVRQFPNQQELVECAKDCGFEEVGFSNLSAGIAAIHYGKKRRVN
jgi:demethylmenaquinone methyltransferase / 2-methoxy-6-polyprenyl-1,4-benzoquinol methylase